MAIQLGALRDALLEAGASPEAAGKAAEELAGYQSEFRRIDTAIIDLRAEISDFRTEMVEFKGELRADLAEIKTDMANFKTETRTEMANFKTEIRSDFNAVRSEASVFKAEVKAEFERVWGELNLHRWMLASIFALLTAVAIKIFLK